MDAQKPKECKFCGNTEHYFIKTTVTGSTRYLVRFDGQEAENGDMYESLKYQDGKYAYCTECGKRLFKIDEVAK